MNTGIPLGVFDKLPLLITATDGTVRLINRAAATLFGCDQDARREKPCWEMVRLYRPDGIPFCKPDCPVRKLAATGQLTPRRLVLSGSQSSVEVLVFQLENSETREREVLHLVFPLAEGKQQRPSRVARKATDVEKKLHRLTPRELEILRLLASGLGTSAIASELFISSTTVRNHVQHILGKLGVHRRLEAIVALMGKTARTRPRPGSGAHSGDKPAE
jgi:DNA-binding CsgD family transcriptional regulator